MMIQEPLSAKDLRRAAKSRRNLRIETTASGTWRYGAVISVKNVRFLGCLRQRSMWNKKRRGHRAPSFFEYKKPHHPSFTQVMRWGSTPAITLWQYHVRAGYCLTFSSFDHGQPAQLLYHYSVNCQF